MNKPDIDTKRLKIRRFTIKDLNDFSVLIRDKMSAEYCKYDEQFPTDDASLSGILAYFSGSDEFFAVELKSENKIIGYISLNRADGDARNLGYCIHSAYRGKGCATEAVGAIITYAKNILRLNRLVSGTAEENTPSVRLLERAGFHRTGSEKGSFANDENGTPVIFTGVSFELIL